MAAGRRDHGESDGSPVKADRVFESEHASIRARRKALGIGDMQETGTGAPAELFGVALSGGGFRSATFCLGALQALNAYGLIPRIDYLSTVSGGGYIGSSMVAAMSRESGGGDFPFANTNDKSDFTDTEAVRHLRDHSRYLIPHGLSDIVASFGIVIRGIVVNLVLLLSVILPLATLTLFANPVAAALERSVAWQALVKLFAGFPAGLAVLGHFSPRFFLTELLLAAFVVYLVVAGIRRSYRTMAEISDDGEPTSRTPSLFLYAIGLVFVVELQSVFVQFAIYVLHYPRITLGTISAYVALFGGVAAFFRTSMFNAVAAATFSESGLKTAYGYLAKGLLVGAALVVPLMVNIGYLLFCAVLISNPSVLSFTFTGGALNAHVAYVLMILGAGLLAIAVAYQTNDVEVPFFVLVRTQKSRVGAVVIGLLLFVLVVLVGEYGQVDDVRVLSIVNCALIAGIAVLVASSFSENANSLHGLYRDRLRQAFRLGGDGRDDDHAALDWLSEERAPYLLINATLNAKRFSEAGDKLADADAVDPIKRGRKAEFFLFSRNFVGSDATDYLPTSLFRKLEPEIDLASAVAISGAAVSSNMGRAGIAMFAPSLALLNLRLGYWLRNPASLRQSEDRLSWYTALRAYLFAECFGLLYADSPRIYVTDGGHIDNLGLYQLLKRRCRLIVVVDAEADAGLNCGALVDVARFARIDLGARISIDISGIRRQAAARARGDSTDAGEPSRHNGHFAIGRIDYTGSGKPEDTGILLYVKSSMTGDEPDYVLDYERRYPAFPHETTIDQFFSEEQMEAYRALGFHAMSRALSEDCQRLPSKGGTAEGFSLLREMKTGLGIPGLEVG